PGAGGTTPPMVDVAATTTAATMITRNLRIFIAKRVPPEPAANGTCLDLRSRFGGRSPDTERGGSRDGSYGRPHRTTRRARRATVHGRDQRVRSALGLPRRRPRSL